MKLVIGLVNISSNMPGTPMPPGVLRCGETNCREYCIPALFKALFDEWIRSPQVNEVCLVATRSQRLAVGFRTTQIGRFKLIPVRVLNNQFLG